MTKNQKLGLVIGLTAVAAGVGFYLYEKKAMAATTGGGTLPALPSNLPAAGDVTPSLTPAQASAVKDKLFANFTAAKCPNSFDPTVTRPMLDDPNTGAYGICVVCFQQAQNIIAADPASVNGVLDGYTYQRLMAS